MAFVTLKDVAQRAGVSAAAVSQILHNKGRFSSDTRQLVLKTVEEMGYVPDQRARSMRSSDTKTVGLLVPVSGYHMTSEPSIGCHRSL